MQVYFSILKLELLRELRLLSHGAKSFIHNELNK